MLEKLTSDPANSWDISIVRRNREIVGGYHTIVAPVGSFIASLGDYLWVSPPERGTGLAKRIYHEILGMRQRMGASAHFGEVNDPFAQPAAKRELDESGGTPPDARVRFWSKQGRLACDAPWLQPALQDGLQEVNYLMLTVHPLVSDFKASITRAEYLAIWESFYSPLADYIDLDPTRVRLRALLGDQEEIQFIPMEQRRSYLAR
jgi:GNAT superfamily N-acetyltransferase